MSEQLNMNDRDGILIERINAAVDTDLIYAYTSENNKVQNTEWLIFPSKADGKEMGERLHLLNGIFSAFPSANFRLLKLKEIEKAIAKGSLFFERTLTIDHLRYERVEYMHIGLEKYKPEGLLTSTIAQNFHEEMDRSLQFKSGAHFYFDHKNYGQAAFMIHQAIELMYRTAEWLLMGVDKKTHSIRLHQLYIANFAPTLGSLFSTPDGNASALIMHLDQAYLAVRYENDYDISESDLHQLFLKTDEMKDMILALFEESLAGYERKRSSTYTHNGQSDEPISSNIGSLLENVLNEVTRYTNPEEVYCVEKHIIQQKFDAFNFLGAEAEYLKVQMSCVLLVVTSEVEAIRRLQNNLDGRTENASTVTLLDCSLKDFYDSQNVNALFYQKIRQKAALCYRRRALVQEMDVNFSHIPSGSVLDKYNSRTERARVLLKMAEQSLTEMHPEIGISSVAYAMEQFCIAILLVFLNYTPKSHTIPHLMRLCSICVPTVGLFFSTQNPEGKKWMKLLVQGNNKLRYKHDVHRSELEGQNLLNQCTQFLTQTDRLCRTQLLVLLEHVPPAEKMAL